MSNETQILIRVQKFMNYHFPDIPRQLPEPARVEYNLLRDVINAHLAAPEPFFPKKTAPKKVAKKASKKASKKKVNKKK